MSFAEPQYVEPQYQPPQYPPPQYRLEGAPLAGWGRRLVAFVIDLSIPFVFFLGAPVLLAALHASSSLMTNFVLALASIVIGAGLTFFNSVYRQGKSGHSWGMALLGLRVVDMQTGRPLGVGRNFKRWLAYADDSAPNSAARWLHFSNEYRQTIADRFVGSIVLRATSAPDPLNPHPHW